MVCLSRLDMEINFGIICYFRDHLTMLFGDDSIPYLFSPLLFNTIIPKNTNLLTDTEVGVADIKKPELFLPLVPQ
jgi:hypothetical protein